MTSQFDLKLQIALDKMLVFLLKSKPSLNVRRDHLPMELRSLVKSLTPAQGIEFFGTLEDFESFNEYHWKDQAVTKYLESLNPPPPPKVEYKNVYTFEKVLVGVCLIRLKDRASVFLQGEDRLKFLDDIEAIDELWAEYADQPFGPYTCQAQHLDALIGNYDHLMSQQQAHYTGQPKLTS